MCLPSLPLCVVEDMKAMLMGGMSDHVKCVQGAPLTGAEIYDYTSPILASFQQQQNKLLVWVNLV